MAATPLYAGRRLLPAGEDASATILPPANEFLVRVSNYVPGRKCPNLSPERGLSSIRSSWMGQKNCELGQLALRFGNSDFKSGHYPPPGQQFDLH